MNALTLVFHFWFSYANTESSSRGQPSWNTSWHKHGITPTKGSGLFFHLECVLIAMELDGLRTFCHVPFPRMPFSSHFCSVQFVPSNKTTGFIISMDRKCILLCFQRCIHATPHNRVTVAAGRCFAFEGLLLCVVEAWGRRGSVLWTLELHWPNHVFCGLNITETQKPCLSRLFWGQ